MKHLHKNFTEEYIGIKSRRICIGQIKYGWYGIITNEGFNLKQI